MITLDQVKRLDKKVQAAVELIRSLKVENSSLQNKLTERESRAKELEALVSQFKEDQGEIEKGIARALKHLDQLEDNISTGTDSKTGSTQEKNDAIESGEKKAENLSTQVETGSPSGTQNGSPSGSQNDSEDVSSSQDPGLDIF